MSRTLRSNPDRPSERFSMVRKIAGQVEKLADAYEKSPAEALLLEVEALDEQARRIMVQRLDLIAGKPQEADQDAQACKMTMRISTAWARIMAQRLEYIPEAQRM